MGRWCRTASPSSASPTSAAHRPSTATSAAPGLAFPPEGEPQFVTLTLGRSTLGLGATTGGAGPHAGTGYTLCAYVADCDAAVDAVRAAGHTVREEPSDQPWGERIARVLDADGYEVLLVARL